MRVNVLLACLLLVAACGKKSNAPAEGSGATPGSGSAGLAVVGDAAQPAVDAAGAAAVDASGPVAPPPDAGAKAKELLDAQVAALKTCEGGAFVATFRTDAVVFTPPGVHEAKDPNAGLCEAVAHTAPNQSVKSIKQGKLVAGGNASAIWVSTTLEITVDGGKPRTIRVTELMAAPDWKVVAASFTATRKLSVPASNEPPIAGANTPGPLTALLVAPTELDAALASDPVALFGTDAAEVALDTAAAHKLLAGWKSLKLAVKSAREVHEPAWGYTQATLTWDKPGEEYGPLGMSAMLIGVPGPNGTWSVVAAHYGPL
jgi:hypothetical protein